MAQVVIGIKAQLDADVDALFAPLEKRAVQAAERIQKSLSDAIKGGTWGVGAMPGAGAGTGGRGGGESAEAKKTKQEAKEKLAILTDAAREEVAIANRVAKEKAAARKKDAADAARQMAFDVNAQVAEGKRLVAAQERQEKDKTRAQQREEKKRQATAARQMAFDVNAHVAEGKRLVAEHERQEKDKTRAQQREEKKRQATAEANARQHESRFRAGAEYASRQFVNRSVHTAQRVLGAGVSAGREMLQGAGVETSLGSYVQRNVQADTAARELSNSAYQPSQEGTPAATRVAPAAIRAFSRDQSTKTTFAELDITSSLAKFQEKTGDLAMAQSLLPEVANIALANKTPLVDAMQHAAVVSNALQGARKEKGGDPMSREELAEATTIQLRSHAGMGQLGAFENPDVAKRSAGMFASARANFGGDTAVNMGQLLAMAQIALLKGGAKNAAAGAIAVENFGGVFDKEARIKKMHGVKTHGEDGKLLAPQDLSLNLIHGAKDWTQLANMLGEKNAIKSMRGIWNIHQEAGEGIKDPKARREAGDKAVKEWFQKFMGATQSKEQVNESANLIKGGPQAQVNKFNNKIAEIVNVLQTELLPVFTENAPKLEEALTSIVKSIVKFAPEISKLIEAAAKMAAWAAENPMKTLAGSLALQLTGAFAQAFTIANLTSMMVAAFTGKAAVDAAVATTAAGAEGAAVGTGTAATAGGAALPVAVAAIVAGAVGATIDQQTDVRGLAYRAKTDVAEQLVSSQHLFDQAGATEPWATMDASAMEMDRKADWIAAKRKDMADQAAAATGAAETQMQGVLPGGSGAVFYTDNQRTAIAANELAPLSVAAEDTARAAAAGKRYAYYKDDKHEADALTVIQKLYADAGALYKAGDPRSIQAGNEIVEAINKLYTLLSGGIMTTDKTPPPVSTAGRPSSSFGVLPMSGGKYVGPG